MAWPRMAALDFGEPGLYGSKVVRKIRSFQTAMPDCPPLGRGARQRMFWLRATDQETGGLASETLQELLGPAAWGQLARAAVARRARIGTERTRVTVSGITAVIFREEAIDNRFRIAKGCCFQALDGLRKRDETATGCFVQDAESAENIKPEGTGHSRATALIEENDGRLI